VRADLTLFYHKNERKLKDCCTGAVNAQSDFQINLVVVSQAIEFVARSSSMLGYAQRPTHVPISDSLPALLGRMAPDSA
jgi:hypothetical protein